MGSRIGGLKECTLIHCHYTHWNIHINLKCSKQINPQLQLQHPASLLVASFLWWFAIPWSEPCRVNVKVVVLAAKCLKIFKETIKKKSKKKLLLHGNFLISYVLLSMKSSLKKIICRFWSLFEVRSGTYRSSETPYSMPLSVRPDMEKSIIF